jgi:hypothetical protein
MVEPAVVSEEPVLQTASEATEPTESLSVELAARVARLEDVVASLQDTHALEDRVTERLSAKLMARARRKNSSSNLIVEAGRQLLPAAIQTIQDQASQADAAGAAGPSLQHHPWLIFDAIAEARAMFRMYFDRRYRVSWIARMTPLVGCILLVLSWLLISGIWIIGPIVDKAFDLVLAFVVYKVLHREVQSYRFAIADLGAVTAYRTVSDNSASPQL